MKKLIFFIISTSFSLSLSGQTIKALEEIALNQSSIEQLSKNLTELYNAPLAGEKSATGDIGYTYISKTNPNKELSVLYNAIFNRIWFFSIKDSSDRLPSYMNEFKSNGYTALSPRTYESGLVKKYPYKKGDFQGIIEIGAEVGDGVLYLDLQYEIK